MCVYRNPFNSKNTAQNAKENGTLSCPYTPIYCSQTVNYRPGTEKISTLCLLRPPGYSIKSSRSYLFNRMNNISCLMGYLDFFYICQLYLDYKDIKCKLILT